LRYGARFLSRVRARRTWPGQSARTACGIVRRRRPVERRPLRRPNRRQHASARMMRAYLVDDEPLALERLSRMLAATGRVEVVGSNTDPVKAVEELPDCRPDLLFLDIHMPGLSGFELLAELSEQPLVIFTTAYDRYALEAFRVNSIDYL